MCLLNIRILCWPPHSPATGVCNLWEIMLKIVCMHDYVCVSTCNFLGRRCSGFSSNSQKNNFLKIIFKNIHLRIILVIYPERMIIWKGTCTHMFITALFTVAKIWEQPKYPSTDEWIKKMWYMFAMDYYSAIKRSEIMAFAATWMDLEIIILSEVSQAEKDKYHMISLICGV